MGETMDTSTLFVALSNLAFAAVCGTVGVRMLRLGRRTRQVPELCLGIGLMGLIISIPVMTYSGLGRVVVAEVRMGAAALALLVLTVGCGFVYAFNWRVFRPQAFWAAGLVAACCVATAALAIGTYLSLARAPGEMDSFEACGDWLSGLYYPMLVSFVWASIEGVREWARGRRRVQLGLGDEVVANRFLLWGLAGALSSANSLLGLYLDHIGLVATKDPIVASLSALGGIGCAILIWLMFMPPASYVRWLRGGDGLEATA